MLIFATILMTALCAFLYRLGGLSKQQAHDQIPWMPEVFINSLTRRLGCTLLSLIWMFVFYPKCAWWAYVASAVMAYVALTTYWDEWLPNKGKDKFWMHGFFIALSYFPFAICTGLWIPLVIRCVVLAAFMGIWCAFWKNDWAEELGRGGSMIASLPIL